ncbi:phosphate ABC transporter substrate-binding protein PstS [Nocardioides cynanchi]|uniref:phosphate ABC transporter substrate-binding protein PstS n=1 Tax=Nocardioides cynanchi TaxID=2558918 RepID=UPI0012456675|nr:phosphate ABC transporter substrate-binding protein PstS [Nocardioides cynanchi]
MKKSTSVSLTGRLVLAALAASLVSLLLVPAPAQAADYVPISGAGSTWSQVAVDAWRADVRASGVVVNYAGTGSTDGRSQFIQGTVDFANTEIPFQNPPEPGQQAEIPSRPYAYLPIVAGGTSFMYNLTVAGQRVRDLRLSGDTLAKIFTGAITRWSDPAITRDYGKTLPDIPIIPVVRSDGAGASAQFTKYMASQAPSVYCPFIRSKLNLSGSACPSVSFYPAFGSSKAQNGSNGVANYVAASYGAGAIGYVEYAYPKRIDFPVVSLLNKAGYYSQPTAGNVAVALTKAKINPDLTQNLDSVYSNPDPRAYPMSSYSYMVVPTSTAAPFNTDKGRTLSTFVNYFLCGGQQKADILGYSPLPKNLVEAGFQQVARIPGAVPSPSITQCHNPALDILHSAPMPDKCMKVGATCDPSTTPSSGGTPSPSGTTTTTPGSSTPAGGLPGSTTPGGTAADPGGGPSGSDPGAAAPDPLTGTPAGGTVTTAGGALTAAAGTPVSLASSRAGQQKAIGWLVAAMLALTVLAPPFLVSRHLRRRP